MKPPPFGPPAKPVEFMCKEDEEITVQMWNDKRTTERPPFSSRAEHCVREATAEASILRAFGTTMAPMTRRRPRSVAGRQPAVSHVRDAPQRQPVPQEMCTLFGLHLPEGPVGVPLGN